LLLATDIHAINAASRRDLPFDPVGDFAPVSRVIEFPLLLLASTKSGYRTIADIVAAARRDPGKVSAASLGSTSPHFIGFRMLEQSAGVRLLDVPYKGSGPALTDLLGGQIDLMFGGISAGLQTAQNNRATSIATTGTKRHPAAAQLPTVIEAGYAEYVVMPWMAILVPRKTPATIVSRLNIDIVQALASPALAKRLGDAGFTPSPTTPAEMESFMTREIERFRKLVPATATEK
jgi:tripartite-type tricarboxylate transporter receptor subunit TctC